MYELKQQEYTHHVIEEKEEELDLKQLPNLEGKKHDESKNNLDLKFDLF